MLYTNRPSEVFTFYPAILNVSDATRLAFPRFVTLEQAGVVEGTEGAHFVQTHHHQSHTSRLIVSFETRKQTLRDCYGDGLHNFHKKCNVLLAIQIWRGGMVKLFA